MATVLSVTIRGLVDQEKLAALRRSLDLTGVGRLDDDEDANFGYRYLLDDGAHMVRLTLWRHRVDRWEIAVMADPEVLPRRDELERLVPKIRAAARSAGLAVEREKIWAA